MTATAPDTLAGWLARIERLHPTEIDMGLDRVRQVHGRLGLRSDIETAITVAGTNGKGSCVAYLESIYEAAGYRTGAYTSPHLQHFNERVHVDGQAVSDADLVAAFQRVETARQDVSLTYFEYSTLAALSIFHDRATDVVILEVGLGGRLDAVNVINPAVSIITSIGLDHQNWLGSDRESIGREKAGILRPGRPAVIGDDQPPDSIANTANEIGARLLQVGVDFDFARDTRTWQWRGCVTRFDKLPLPRFGGVEQLSNAACALAAIEQLADRLRVDGRHIDDGLRDAQLPGRFQQLVGERNWILDVAHNAEAAGVLAQSLLEFAGRTVAVIGVMDDKPVEAIGLALDERVDEWIVIRGDASRSLTITQLAQRLEAQVRGPVNSAESLIEGLEAAARKTSAADRILVTGSFRVVGPALDYLYQHA